MTGKGLDFVVMCTGGAGGNSFCHYLRQHSSIFLDHGSRPSDLFNAKRESALLDVMPKNKISGVYLHHAWDLYTQRYLDEAKIDHQVDAAFSQRLAQICKRRHFIQIVRDPLTHLLSLINYTISGHVLDHAFSDDYDFKELDFDLDFEIRLRCEQCVRQGQVVKAAILDGDGRPCFDHWEVIDTSEITGDKTAATMRGVLGRLGLDDDGLDIDYETAIGSLDQRYRRRFPFSLSLGEGRITCSLAFEGERLGGRDKLAELSNVTDFFIDKRLCPFDGRKAFFVLQNTNLDSASMAALRESLDFDELFLRILPHWAAIVGRTHERYLAHKISRLDSRRLDLARKLLEDDVRFMTKLQPRLQTLWTYHHV